MTGTTGKPMTETTPSHVRLARNTALSLVAIGLLGAGRLVYNIVVGRRFGVAALGEATLAINAAMFATLLVSGGWQTSTAKYVAQAAGGGDRALAAGIYRRTLLHNASGGVVVAALVAAVLAVVPEAGLRTRDAILAGAIAFAYNAYQHLKSAHYGFGMVESYLRLEALSSGAMLAALAVVAVAATRSAILWPVAGGYALFAILSAARLRGGGAAKPVPAPLWREIRGFTALAIAGTVASAGFLNLSPVFVGRYDSPRMLGVFSAALALVIPVYFVPRALSLALFPSIAYRYGEERLDSVRRQLHETGRALWILLLAPVAAAAVTAPVILRWLFGAGFDDGALILTIMMGATYLSVVQIPYVTTLSGTDRRYYKVPVLASIAGFGVGVGVWVTLGARDGATGVAWGYLIGSVPQAAIPIAFAVRTFGVRIASVVVRAAMLWVIVAAIVWQVRIDETGSAMIAVLGVLAVYAVLFGRDLGVLAASLVARRRAGRGDAG
ncbi:MAG TPA: lipopolysaccharide biosynthesis protein [Actinomycetota bacterium]|nr:lipopolysaccharide biosynthesis protein [Actinomycetota bacterium]